MISVVFLLIRKYLSLFKRLLVFFQNSNGIWVKGFFSIYRNSELGK